MLYDPDICYNLDVCETDEYDQLLLRMIIEISQSIYYYICIIFRLLGVLICELIFIAISWCLVYHCVLKKTKFFNDLVQ